MIVKNTGDKTLNIVLGGKICVVKPGQEFELEEAKYGVLKRIFPVLVPVAQKHVTVVEEAAVEKKTTKKKKAK